MKLVQFFMGVLLVLTACSKTPQNPVINPSAGGQASLADSKLGCTEDQCGPKPAVANVICADGKTMAGPRACEKQATGGCGWTMVTCPIGKDGCTLAECGPEPLSANTTCPDGKTVAGPGACEPQKDGSCGWTMVSCPVTAPPSNTACEEKECGPRPLASNTTCPDGKTVAGPGSCIRQQDGRCGYQIVTCPPPAQNNGCEEKECGPRPAIANAMCPDGKTMAGPGECVRQANGRCGYQIISCRVPAQNNDCEEKECGMRPEMPSAVCPDGKTIAGPGPCIRQPTGQCAWTILRCPTLPAQNAK